MIEKRIVKLDELHFDPANPRLVGDFGTDEPKMFRFLITTIGVEDLLESLSTSGLFEADPIIVRERAEGGYFVIEGNRRLAALKLLTGTRPNDELPIPQIPKCTEKVRRSFDDIAVEIGWPDDTLQAYLGYKHVTASRQWSPEAKAKFVFDHAKGDFSEINLREFAKTLGTKYPTLRRWLVAYLVIRQAEALGIFDPTFLPPGGYFGRFYTLLGGASARTFLEIKDDPIVADPIPAAKHDELAEFIQWTIGTKTESPKVNSRQQYQFEQVLSSETALRHFRVKMDLDAALLYTEYNSEEIAGKLRSATFSIEDCLPKLNDVRENEQVMDAFNELEGAFKKARLNMKSPERG